MKTSDLKHIIKEALSEDESKAVLDKYKKRYAAVLKSNPKFIKKYSNPDAVIYGMVMNEVKKLKEKLGKNADVGDYIDDFRKSDAPQFQGKSKKKRDQMAKAAFLNREEQTLGEIDAIMEEDELTKSEKNKLKKVSSQLKKSVKAHDKQSKTIDKIVSETGEDIAKINMDRYKEGNMKENRLTELVKAALMGPISEKKKDHDGDGDIDSKDYLIARDKAIKKAKGKKTNESVASQIQANNELDKIEKDSLLSVSKKGEDGILKMLAKMGMDIKDIPTKYGGQKKIMEEDTNESFKSLSKKIDKQKGKTKKDGDNIAGFIANRKREGAGKGPTKKMKKREGIKERILRELRGQ